MDLVSYKPRKKKMASELTGNYHLPSLISSEALFAYNIHLWLLFVNLFYTEKFEQQYTTGL